MLNSIHFASHFRFGVIDLVRMRHVKWLFTIRRQIIFRKCNGICNYVIYKFAASYAKKNNDKSFDVRLALGLARSFITSTRFILDRTLAKNMFYRGVYLLESIQRYDSQDDKKFELKVKELFA